MDNVQARLNVTFAGQNGDMVDTIPYDLDLEAVKQIAKEAVASGSVPGIAADPNADFTDFVADRFPAVGDLPCRVLLRPKVPFGAC